MWSAMIKFDDGRLGYSACFGLKTRDEAIDWLNRAFSWDRCWFMLPSWHIKYHAPAT